MRDRKRETQVGIETKEMHERETQGGKQERERESVRE
jgi:hypothetical protein